MKLKIKKKYFDRIKAGSKTIDFRDAHITFVCEEDGEMLVKRVVHCDVIRPSSEMISEFRDVLVEDHVIRFFLESSH
jgi:hypothetical protein